MTPGALVLIASLYLAVAIVVLGKRKLHYSHIQHTISELAEIGSPVQRVTAYGVFLPVGLLLALVAYELRFSHGSQAILAACIAAGYLIAAFFPCDPGSPISGSLRQAIHNLGGAVQYAGGALALFRISESLGGPFQIAGLVAGIAMLLLSFPHRYRGLVQRIAETCLFGGLLFSLW